MRKFSKISLTVLTLGALIGTGYAAWHISNGFKGASVEADSVIDSGHKNSNFAHLEVVRKEGDGKLCFGTDTKSKLNAIFTVKTIVDSPTIDVFNLNTYKDLVAKPDLKVTVTPLRYGSPLSGNDLTNLNKYISYESPTSVAYTEWLLQSETGYDFDYRFTWNTAYFGADTPEQYFSKKIDPKAEIDAMNAAFKDVTFKFAFRVGAFEDHSERSGLITYPASKNGETFAITNLDDDNKVKVGDQQITITVPEGYGIPGNSVRIVATDDFGGAISSNVNLVEDPSSTNELKVYKFMQTFQEGYSYNFEYSVKQHVTIGSAISGVCTIEYEKSEDDIYLGDTVKFHVNYNPKYYKGAKVTVDPGTINDLGNNNYSFVADTSYLAIHIVLDQYPMAMIETYVEGLGTFTIDEAYDMLPLKYLVGETLTLNATPAKNWELSHFVLDNKTTFYEPSYLVQDTTGHIIKAVFVKQEATVEIADTQGFNVTVSPSNVIEAGDTVTFNIEEIPNMECYDLTVETEDGVIHTLEGNTFVVEPGRNIFSCKKRYAKASITMMRTEGTKVLGINTDKKLDAYRVNDDINVTFVTYEGYFVSRLKVSYDGKFDYINARGKNAFTFKVPSKDVHIDFEIAREAAPKKIYLANWYQRQDSPNYSENGSDPYIQLWNSADKAHTITERIKGNWENYYGDFRRNIYYFDIPDVNPYDSCKFFISENLRSPELRFSTTDLKLPTDGKSEFIIDPSFEFDNKGKAYEVPGEWGNKDDFKTKKYYGTIDTSEVDPRLDVKVEPAGPIEYGKHATITFTSNQPGYKLGKAYVINGKARLEQIDNILIQSPVTKIVAYSTAATGNVGYVVDSPEGVTATITHNTDLLDDYSTLNITGNYSKVTINDVEVVPNKVDGKATYRFKLTDILMRIKIYDVVEKSLCRIKGNCGEVSNMGEASLIHGADNILQDGGLIHNFDFQYKSLVDQTGVHIRDGYYTIKFAGKKYIESFKINTLSPIDCTKVTFDVNGVNYSANPDQDGFATVNLHGVFTDQIKIRFGLDIKPNVILHFEIENVPNMVKSYQ